MPPAPGYDSPSVADRIACVRAGADELILSSMAWSVDPVGDAERVHAAVVMPAREAPPAGART